MVGVCTMLGYENRGVRGVLDDSMRAKSDTTARSILLVCVGTEIRKRWLFYYCSSSVGRNKRIGPNTNWEYHGSESTVVLE